MAITKDEKINFAFKLALEVAKSKSSINLEEYLRLKFEFSEDDIGRVLSRLDDIEIRRENGDYASYIEFSQIIHKAGFGELEINAIIGVLYAGRRFRENVDSWKNIPVEIKHIIEKVKKYEKCPDLSKLNI